MIKWFANLIHRAKPDDDRGEVSAVTVRLSRPVPPAKTGMILTRRDWERAMKESAQREAADSR